MTEIFLPLRPRRDDPNNGYLAVQQNVDALAAMFTRGTSSGQVPVWDNTLSKFVTGPIVTRGTSLPTNPIDGQEAILTDSLTNPTYSWRLRYNAASISAYKWEFIGGAYKGNYNGTLAAHPGTSTWDNLISSDGPSFTLTNSGDYEFTCHAVYYGATSGASTGFIGISTNGNIDPVYGVEGVSAGIQYKLVLGFTAQFVNLTAGNVCKLRYWANGTSPQFYNRALHLRPVRIS